MNIFHHYRQLVSSNGARDERHIKVASARKGDFDALMPGFFPAKLPKQATANIVNMAATDVGEMLSALPAVNCRPRGSSQSEQRRASLRTRIVNNYVETSNLESHMANGGDRFATFGHMAFVVDPDYEHDRPFLWVDESVGGYYELDIKGRVRVYFQRWFETASELAAKFPEVAKQIYGPGQQLIGERPIDPDAASANIEIVRGYYKDYSTGKIHCTTFLPDRENLVLKDATYKNLTRVPVTVAERPKWDQEVRGQFDEAVWVQVLRARMELLTLQAADEAVNAPIRVPGDVTKVPTGPRAIIRTNSDQPVERVKLEVPREAFLQGERMQREERLATRYPEGRSGNMDASVITGQGVQALLGQLDTQLKAYQQRIGLALQEALSIAMEMDEVLFSGEKKTIEGTANGETYLETYDPSKDLKGDYRVQVSYGFAAGLDPNRALVFMLQLRGDRLVDRDTVMRQLPFEGSVSSMKERIDLEEIDDALKQGLFGMATQIGAPELAAMGVDPRKVIHQLATVKKEREKGKALDEAIAIAFEPTEEELAAAEAAQQNPLEQAMSEEEQMLGGGGGDVPARGLGSPQGEATGDIQMLLAGLTQGGDANLQAGLSRMRTA